MTTAGRRGILAVVVAIALLALGAGLGVVAGGALGIHSENAAQMTPGSSSTPSIAPAVPPPAELVVQAPRSARMDAATDELAAAVASAAGTGAPATLTVTAGAGHARDDSYTLAGTAGVLRVTAASEAGATRAVYDLAARIRAHRSVTEHVGRVAASTLPLRMADLGAVGVTADPADWAGGTDYSHASKAFENAYLADAPYIDQDALAADYADWDLYLRHIVAEGYNAVAWPGFIEYADFAGTGVYPAGDSHLARATAMREAFAPFWNRAAQLGVKVYLRTDMLALTPALQDYLDRHFGSDTEDPALWKVYTQALDRLYRSEPALSGILIRIGEGGAIYQTPGLDYYSSISVRTVAGVRTMLTAFLGQAEASDREVVFRTWSVGIGAVGDMHTDPASYEKVLHGIDSPRLIVSTKYTLGDFYSWLPLNITLAQGDQRRIVEFQSRREFEGFGAFPNDLGPEFQGAMQQLLAANPHIEGVWAWTQDGGPWRAGPMTLYLKHGFWQLYDLNARLASAIARDPAVDVGLVTQNWVRENFSADSATVSAIADALALSRDAVRQGLYVQPFAQKRVFALGLEPPPQMWLFEWDILTGDSATLDVMATIVGDRSGQAIAEGDAAVASAQRMRSLVASTDASTWHDPSARTAFLDTLDYETDTLQLLSSYRRMFLAQAQWHESPTAAAHARWQTARDGFEQRAATHVAAYGDDLEHPAWNLTAAQLGVQRADRDLPMAWLARVLLALAVAWVVIGILSARTSLVRRPGAAAARASWLASTRPWRARESTLGMLQLDRWLLLIVPVALLVATRAVQTSLLGWVHLAVVIGAWAVFALVVRLVVWDRSPWPVIAAVGGVVMLRCIVTLIGLSFSGPGGAWFAFWTDPPLRTLYIGVGFALFVWAFVAAGWALHAQLGARRALGAVLAAVGAGLAVPAAVVGAVGLERVLTVWNDQLGMLPWGLARILGITTYLEIPDATAWWVAGVGLLTAAIGTVLALPRRERVRVR